MVTLHIRTYSDELPSLNSTSDGDRYEFAVYRNCHEHGPNCYVITYSGPADLDANPSALRVPDARPAADAPGGEHDLADR